MKVAQIRSLLARQMSTHQSTLPVLEALIDYLAENEPCDAGKPGCKLVGDHGHGKVWTAEQVPAASVTEAAPLSTETAEAPAPPKEADQSLRPHRRSKQAAGNRLSHYPEVTGHPMVNEHM